MICGMFHTVISQGGVFLTGDTTVACGAEHKALWSLGVVQGGCGQVGLSKHI